jgi:hypothetical protein
MYNVTEKTRQMLIEVFNENEKMKSYIIQIQEP